MYKYDERKLKDKVGKLIANKRKNLNLSQEELSEKIGVHIRTISKIENGHSFVSAETLCKLCNFFNLPPKSFFEIDKVSDKRNKKLNELVDKIELADPKKFELYYNIINVIDTESGK